MPEGWDWGGIIHFRHLLTKKYSRWCHKEKQPPSSKWCEVEEMCLDWRQNIKRPQKVAEMRPNSKSIWEFLFRESHTCDDLTIFIEIPLLRQLYFQHPSHTFLCLQEVHGLLSAEPCNWRKRLVPDKQTGWHRTVGPFNRIFCPRHDALLSECWHVPSPWLERGCRSVISSPMCGGEYVAPTIPISQLQYF